jgi:hypothetical protein
MTQTIYMKVLGVIFFATSMLPLIGINPNTLVLSSATVSNSGIVTAAGGGASVGDTILLVAQNGSTQTVIGSGIPDSSGTFTIVANSPLAQNVYAVWVFGTVTNKPSNVIALRVGGTITSFIARLIEKYFTPIIIT